MSFLEVKDANRYMVTALPKLPSEKPGSKMKESDERIQRSAEEHAPAKPERMSTLDKIRWINEQVKTLVPSLQADAAALLMAEHFPEFGNRRREQPTSGVPPESETADFASLVEKWSPSTQSDWALLAAYQLARNQGQTTFMGQTINSILKHHGRPVTNITVAVGRLVEARPALVLQVKKAGTTRQAKKWYKITTSGIEYVEQHFRATTVGNP